MRRYFPSIRLPLVFLHACQVSEKVRSEICIQKIKIESN